MAKNVKPDGNCIDEANRTMYATFCNAANSLSQLYAQAESQQKLAFQAGERHSLEKMYDWILRQEEDGKRITASDVILRLQVATIDLSIVWPVLSNTREEVVKTNSITLGRSQCLVDINGNSHKISTHILYCPNPITQTDYSSIELSMAQTMRPLSMMQTKQSVCVSGLSCPTRNHAQLGQMASQERWAGCETGLENGGFDPVECSSPDGMDSNVSSTHNFLQHSHQFQEVGTLDLHETAMDM